MSKNNRKLNKSFEKSLSPNIEMLLTAFHASGYSKKIDLKKLENFIDNEINLEISFINLTKIEMHQIDQSIKNMDKMRLAINAIRECIDYNKNSNEIIFRSRTNNTELLRKEWEEKCEKLKQSLFYIPPPTKKSPIWHDIVSHYFCFYCAITETDSFSRSGPAVRFISSILGGDISPASIEGVLKKWKKNPFWKLSIKMMTESLESNYAKMTQDFSA